MTKEIIEKYRNIIKPYVGKQLLWTNFEGLGESDKAEFERDFDEILDLAILALEQNPCNDIPTITIPVEDYIKLIEQEPRWIPVSERLPKNKETVLVTFKHFVSGNTIGLGSMILLRGKPHWHVREQNLGTYDVLAWMPLPEPYKAESEDKE